MPLSSDTPTRHDRHGRYPEAATVEDFQFNLAAVQARIEAACQRVGPRSSHGAIVASQ
nr:hypothetical protein PJ912_10170 [Pectobacterium colocasium]